MVEGTPAEGTPAEGAPGSVSAEGTPAEGTPAEGTPAEGTPAEGAPETYADFTFPEGVEKDDTLMEAFLPLAKTYNLTQEQAQALIDIQAQGTQAATTAQETAYADAVKTWTDELKADKDLGGENYDKTLAAGQKALDKLGTPVLKELVEAWSLNSHVEFAKFFAAVAHAIGEDDIDPGNTGPGEKDPASIMFGDTMTA